MLRGVSTGISAPGGATAQAGGPPDARHRTDFGRLRRKLRHGDQPAPIVTARGIGYMFSATVDRC